jgi:hypothetical protein
MLSLSVHPQPSSTDKILAVLQQFKNGSISGHFFVQNLQFLHTPGIPSPYPCRHWSDPAVLLTCAQRTLEDAAGHRSPPAHRHTRLGRGEENRSIQETRRSLIGLQSDCMAG